MILEKINNGDERKKYRAFAKTCDALYIVPVPKASIEIKQK